MPKLMTSFRELERSYQASCAFANSIIPAFRFIPLDSVIFPSSPISERRGMLEWTALLHAYNLTLSPMNHIFLRSLEVHVI